MNNIAICVNNENKNENAKETIDAIKNAGFKNVFIQWYNEDFDLSQEEQLKYINELRLNVIFAHLGYQNLNVIWEPGIQGALYEKRYINDLNECKKHEIELVIIHPVSGTTVPAPSQVGLGRFKAIVEHAKKLGIKIAFENTKVKDHLEFLLNNIQDEHVGTCIDTGHYHCHWNDEVNIDLIKNRVFAVHIHDNDKSYDQHLLPFDGTIDWSKTVKVLNDCNYERPITLESCYSECYNIPIQDFYNKAYDNANKLVRMINR